MKATWRDSPLEIMLAAQVRRVLAEASAGDALTVSPTSDLSAALERTIPEVLVERYPVWKGESLDAVVVSRALRTGPDSVQIFGACILITDQSLTPLYSAFGVMPSQDAIATYEVRIGEPGGGLLGISGPPCNSGRATRYIHRLLARFDAGAIDWVYQCSG